MFRLIVVILAVLVAGLAGLASYRTLNFVASPPPSPAQLPDLAGIDVGVDAAARRLGEALRFRTVSIVDGEGDRGEFERFHTWLSETYPAFHAAATREMVGGLSLLYTWRGGDAAQPPLLLLAHQDVVPAPEDTLADWRGDPFSGAVEEGAIWGRGAIDDKASLIAIMEAVERIAASGRAPARTIVLAFGHDEEIGGEEGALAMATLLGERRVHAWFALDEGMAAVTEHPLTGGPASMIGVSEKGFATLLVRAAGQPGHSSMPPPQTAVSLLAEAITRIHQMPIARTIEGGPAREMMRALADELPLPTRVAVANEWLAGPMLQAQLADQPVALALLGTTIAPTMIAGGVRPNVLPAEATARINLRIHPRDTADDLLARARAAVAELEGVSVEWEREPLEASPVSSAETASYALLTALSRELIPEAPVAPGLVLGGTDARRYVDVAQDVYRFQPVLLSTDDLAGIHGVNERISIENYERLIRFYLGLIEAGAMAQP